MDTKNKLEFINKQVLERNLRLEHENKKIKDEHQALHSSLLSQNRDLQTKLSLENEYLKLRLQQDHHQFVQKLKDESEVYILNSPNPKNTTSQWTADKIIYSENPLLEFSHLHSGHTHPVKCLSIDSKETVLLSGDQSGCIIQWDLKNNYPHHYGPYHTDTVWAILLTPCEKFFYSFSGKNFFLMVKRGHGDL
jgi:WD40 repeat protein